MRPDLGHDHVLSDLGVADLWIIETLLGKTLIPDAAADHVLDRLAESEVDDIVAMAVAGSRLRILCAAALQRRPSRAVPSCRATARRLFEKLPSDEELSRAGDPQAILVGLIKSRDMDRDRKIQHALSSSYLTKGIAWQVRVSALEGHPVSFAVPEWVIDSGQYYHEAAELALAGRRVPGPCPREVGETAAIVFDPSDPARVRFLPPHLASKGC